MTVGCAGAFATPDVGLVDGSLRGCEPNSSCVSTSSGRSPSQYLPPWDYSGLSTGEAFVRLKSAVVKRGGRVVEEQAELNYIRAELPFGKEMDVAEFKLIADPDVILYREFSLINKPDPPGCLGFGCINVSRTQDVKQLRLTRTSRLFIYPPLK
eukprot:1096205-Pyramimonas_sp.AAC.1